MHIDYPNRLDRQRFGRAKAHRLLGPGARMGGAIGIHGEKRGLSWLPHKWLDWTQGCIAVDDDEIEELYRDVVRGASIVIHR